MNNLPARLATWMPPTLPARERGARIHQILQAYGEPERAYHTLQHIAECFAFLDREAAWRYDKVRETFAGQALEGAVWMHDFHYDPKYGDNETRSAEQALVWWGDTPMGERIAALVLCTKHHEAPEWDIEAQWLLDADLSILAASPERFAEYDAQIRQEYAWVPGLIYNAKRRKVLQGFLSRERLYHIPANEAKYGPLARENLRRAVGKKGRL